MFVYMYIFLNVRVTLGVLESGEERESVRIYIYIYTYHATSKNAIYIEKRSKKLVFRTMEHFSMVTN